MSQTVDIANSNVTEPSRVSASSLNAMLGVSSGLLLMLATAFNPLDQSDTTPVGSSGMGLNLEVALKLMVAGSAAVVTLIGLVAVPRTRLRLLRPAGSMLLMLALVLLITSAFAYPAAAVSSRAAALITAIYIGFIAVALHYWNPRGVMAWSLIGLTLHMLLAWGLYLFAGDAGVYEEQLAQETIVRRMGGTAHPNSLGRIGALCCILCVGLWRSGDSIKSRIIFIALLAIFSLAIATMLETMSRTALLSGFVALSAMFVDRLRDRRVLAMGLLLFSLGCLLLVGTGLISDSSRLGESVVQAGTKTGDVNELTSATGRTRIWAEGLRLFLQRPLTGWGMVSAPLLMTDFSFHTHNLLLHALFSAGILAGTLVAGLLLWSIRESFLFVDPLLRGVTTYICISGIFEDTAFEPFPFASTLLWLTVLLTVRVHGENREAVRWM